MAKKKYSQRASPPQASPSVASGTERQGPGTGSQMQSPLPPRFTVRDYLLLNVIFDLFCILQLVLARVIIRETTGLYFFFGLLMVGFLLVSVFDYVYDRTAWPTPTAEKT